MNSDFPMTPELVQQAIAQHQRKIDELRDLESAICRAAEEGEYYDIKRQIEIGEEIKSLLLEQNKLKPYLEVK